jgi:hypothetical protein
MDPAHDRTRSRRHSTNCSHGAQGRKSGWMATTVSGVAKGCTYIHLQDDTKKLLHYHTAGREEPMSAAFRVPPVASVERREGVGGETSIKDCILYRNKLCKSYDGRESIASHHASCPYCRAFHHEVWRQAHWGCPASDEGNCIPALPTLAADGSPY